MTKIGPLFPVYDEKYKEFFVDPSLAKLCIISYSHDDPYGRKGYTTQFLKVPVVVPNYLALCRDPAQRPWAVTDEIHPGSLQVDRLIIRVKVKDQDHHFFITTKTVASSSFAPAYVGPAYAMLDMRLCRFGGFVAESWSDGPIGEELFADFKKAGFEPLFNVGILGQYARQQGSMALNGCSGGLEALRNIETGEFINVEDAPDELEELIMSIPEFQIVGAQLRQELI